MAGLGESCGKCWQLLDEAQVSFPQKAESANAMLPAGWAGPVIARLLLRTPVPMLCICLSEDIIGKGRGGCGR